MAGYGDQGYNQDFYESGYDMDGVQQQRQAPPHEQQVPAAIPPAQSQWSGGTGVQQAYYSPASYAAQQSYGQQQGYCAQLCRSDVQYTNSTNFVSNWSPVDSLYSLACIKSTLSISQDTIVVL